MCPDAAAAGRGIDADVDHARLVAVTVADRAANILVTLFRDQKLHVRKNPEEEEGGQTIGEWRAEGALLQAGNAPEIAEGRRANDGDILRGVCLTAQHTGKVRCGSKNVLVLSHCANRYPRRR